MVVFLSVYQHWFNSSKQKRVYKWAYNGRGINTELFSQFDLKLTTHIAIFENYLGRGICMADF